MARVTDADLEDFSSATMTKARVTARSGLTQDPDHPAIWSVRSLTKASTEYRVQLLFDDDDGTLSWITCTCPHGLNKGGGASRCYHAAAVLVHLLDGGDDA